MASVSSNWLVLLLPLLTTAHFGVQCSAKVSAVIVFGDSLVDTGNNNWIPTTSRGDYLPYGQDLHGGTPTGRFCNGKVIPDFASEAFGLEELVPAYLDPALGISDFATGVNFASAGAGYDNKTSSFFNAIPLLKQVEYYKEYQSRLRAFMGDESAMKVIEDALHLINIGTNDILETYFVLGRRFEFTLDGYHRFIIGIAESFLRELYTLGARKITLVGIAPTGCLPIARDLNVLGGRACEDKFSAAARGFNAKLSDLVEELVEELDQIELSVFDLYDLVNKIVSSPRAFGFEVVDKECCSKDLDMVRCGRNTPFTCRDPDKYAFWDAVHPTERTNKIIVDYLIENEWSKFL